MGNSSSVNANANATYDIRNNINYENFMKKRYENALRNYQRKLSSYNYAYHGNYADYVYQIQAEMELECLDVSITSGSCPEMYSRFT